MILGLVVVSGRETDLLEFWAQLCSLRSPSNDENTSNLGNSHLIFGDLDGVTCVGSSAITTWVFVVQKNFCTLHVCTHSWVDSAPSFNENCFWQWGAQVKMIFNNVEQRWKWWLPCWNSVFNCIDCLYRQPARAVCVPVPSYYALSNIFSDWDWSLAIVTRIVVKRSTEASIEIEIWKLKKFQLYFVMIIGDGPEVLSV